MPPLHRTRTFGTIFASHPSYHPSVRRCLPNELFGEILDHLSDDDPEAWVNESRHHYLNVALACRFLYFVAQVYLYEDLFTSFTEEHRNPLPRISPGQTALTKKFCEQLVAGNDEALYMARYVKRWTIAANPTGEVSTYTSSPTDSINISLLAISDIRLTQCHRINNVPSDLMTYFKASAAMVNLTVLTISGVRLTDEMIDSLIEFKSLKALRIVRCPMAVKTPSKFKSLKLVRLDLFALSGKFYKQIVPYIDFGPLQRWRVNRLETLEGIPPFKKGAKFPLQHLEVHEFDTTVADYAILAMFPSLEKLRYEAINSELDGEDYDFNLSSNHLPQLRHLEFPANRYLRSFFGCRRPISFVNILPKGDWDVDDAYDIYGPVLDCLKSARQTISHLVIGLECYTTEDSWAQFTKLRHLELRIGSLDIMAMEEKLELIEEDQGKHNPNVDTLTFILGPDQRISNSVDPTGYFTSWLTIVEKAFPSLRTAYFVGAETFRLTRAEMDTEWR